jgi:hypothetical protein
MMMTLAVHQAHFSCGRKTLCYSLPMPTSKVAIMGQHYIVPLPVVSRNDCSVLTDAQLQQAYNQLRERLAYLQSNQEAIIQGHVQTLAFAREDATELACRNLAYDIALTRTYFETLLMEMVGRRRNILSANGEPEQSLSDIKPYIHAQDLR